MPAATYYHDALGERVGIATKAQDGSFTFVTPTGFTIENATVSPSPMHDTIVLNGPSEADRVAALKAVNAELESDNAELEKLNADLQKANAELEAKIKELQESKPKK